MELKRLQERRAYNRVPARGELKNQKSLETGKNRNLVPVFIVYGDCANLERNTSPDPYFFLFRYGKEKKYKGQGMKSLAGIGAEPHKPQVQTNYD